MRNFAEQPREIDRRYDPIFKACLQNSLGEQELKQCFRAMITDDEIQGIAEAYREEGFEEGLAQGLEQGLQQGMLQGAERERREVAAAMLKLGIVAELVSKATGLSVSDVRALV